MNAYILITAVLNGVIGILVKSNSDKPIYNFIVKAYFISLSIWGFVLVFGS